MPIVRRSGRASLICTPSSRSGLGFPQCPQLGETDDRPLTDSRAGGPVREREADGPFEVGPSEPGALPGEAGPVHRGVGGQRRSLDGSRPTEGKREAGSSGQRLTGANLSTIPDPPCVNLPPLPGAFPPPKPPSPHLRVWKAVLGMGILVAVIGSLWYFSGVDQNVAIVVTLTGAALSFLLVLLVPGLANAKL